MKWRLIRVESFEGRLAMTRSAGRCELRLKFSREHPRGVPCDAEATEVIETEGPVYVCACRDCRRRGFGMSSAERGSATREFNKRQVDLFGKEVVNDEHGTMESRSRRNP